MTYLLTYIAGIVTAIIIFIIAFAIYHFTFKERSSVTVTGNTSEVTGNTSQVTEDVGSGSVTRPSSKETHEADSGRRKANGETPSDSTISSPSTGEDRGGGESSTNSKEQKDTKPAGKKKQILDLLKEEGPLITDQITDKLDSSRSYISRILNDFLRKIKSKYFLTYHQI